MDLHPGAEVPAEGGQNKSHRGTLKRLPKEGAFASTPTCPEDKRIRDLLLSPSQETRTFHAAPFTRGRKGTQPQHVQEMNGQSTMVLAV